MAQDRTSYDYASAKTRYGEALAEAIWEGLDIWDDKINALVTEDQDAMLRGWPRPTPEDAHSVIAGIVSWTLTEHAKEILDILVRSRATVQITNSEIVFKIGKDTYPLELER